MVCSGWVVVSVRMLVFFFFQAEDGIRDLVRSRGLGDVYKRQVLKGSASAARKAVFMSLSESAKIARNTRYLMIHSLSLIHI